MVLVALEQGVELLIDGRVHDQLELRVVPLQCTLVQLYSGDGGGIILVLLADEPAKEGEDVVTLDGNTELFVQLLGVVLGEGLGLGSVHLLCTRDDTLTDESIGSGEVGSIHYVVWARVK